MGGSLTITRGLPASGKSTWARQWLAIEPAKRRRVNRDDIRAMLFHKPTYTADQEKQVTELVRQMVKDLLKAGFDVVTDDTNIRPKYVREWARFAKANNAFFGVHEFNVDADECIRRDALRERSVGADVIRGMAKFLKSGEFLPWNTESLDTHSPDTYVPRPETPRAIIVDIDGTVALMNGRSPYEMDRVGEDLPNTPVISAVCAMYSIGWEVVFCSGRDAIAREDTILWIKEHVGIDPTFLYMRPDDDKRKDSIVKRELFDKYIRDNFNVQLVFDDRQQVVDMWRGLGLTVAQVAEGDF